MLFNSIDFLIFFPIVFVSYWLLARRAQNALLLVSSYVFYAWWDWRLLGRIVFSSALDYTVGRGMAASGTQQRRRVFLGLSLVSNLGRLGFFKYCNFFIDSAAGLPYRDDEDTLRRIERSDKRFERGAFAELRVPEFQAFLERAKARGAVVAGIAIPLDSQVRAALRASAEHGPQLAAYQARLRESFDVAGLPYVDAVDHFGLPDRWMINGFHGSEHSMAHVVRAWLTQPATREALPELTAAPLDCLIRAAERDGLVEGPGVCAGARPAQ